MAHNTSEAALHRTNANFLAQLCTCGRAGRHQTLHGPRCRPIRDHRAGLLLGNHDGTSISCHPLSWRIVLDGKPIRATDSRSQVGTIAHRRWMLQQRASQPISCAIARCMLNQLLRARLLLAAAMFMHCPGLLDEDLVRGEIKRPRGSRRSRGATTNCVQPLAEICDDPHGAQGGLGATASPPREHRIHCREQPSEPPSRSNPSSARENGEVRQQVLGVGAPTIPGCTNNSACTATLST